MIRVNWLRFLAFSSMILFQNVHLSAQQSASDFYKITVNALKYNDYDNVIFFANKAIALNPDYGAAYWNRAIAYDNLDSFQKALQDYSKSLSLFPDSTDQATIFKNIGMVYNDMRQSDSAILFFDKAIELHHNYGVAFWNRGLAYDGNYEYGLAIKDYTTALGIVSSSKDKETLYVLRGTAFFRIKQIEKANADFRSVLALDTTPDYHTAYAMYFLHSQDSAKQVIRKFIIRARTNQDEYASSYFTAACLFSVMTNKEKALSCLDMCLSLGYKRYHNINVSRDLDFVRPDPQFKDILAKYKDKK